MIVSFLFGFLVLSAEHPDQMLCSAKELAKLISSRGVHVRVSSELAQRLILVRSAIREPARLATALAVALDAEESEMGGQTVIARSPKALRSVQERLASVRMHWIDAKAKRVREFRKGALAGGYGSYLGFAKKKIDELGAFQSGRITSYSDVFPCHLLPSEGLLLEILSALDLRQLGGQPAGTVRVWRYPQGRFTDALPLPPGAMERLGQAESSFKHEKVDAQSLQLIKMIDDEESINEVEHAVGTPSVLRLTENASRNGMTFRLEGFDNSGASTFVAYLGVNSPQGQMAAPGLMRKLTSEDKADFVPLTPSAQAMLNLDSVVAKVPVPRWLSNPTTVDPLTAFAAEGIGQLLSRDLGDRDLVVAMCDPLAADVRGSCSRGKLSLGTLRQMLESWTPYDIVEERGFRVARPVDPDLASYSTADRRELQQFFADAKQSGQISVWPLARLYRSALSHSPARFGEQSGYINAWAYRSQAFGVTERVTSTLSPAFYRVLGAVTPDQIEQLELGRSVAVRSFLNPDEWQNFLEIEPRFSRASVQGDSGSAAIWKYGLEHSSSADIDAARLRLDKASHFVFKTWGADSSEPRAVWNEFSAISGAVGLPRVKRNDRSSAPSIATTRADFEAIRRKDWFVIGQTEDDVFTITLPDGYSISGTYRSHVRSLTEPSQYADLPDDVRERIWQTVSEQVLSIARRDDRDKTPMEVSGPVTKPT